MIYIYRCKQCEHKQQADHSIHEDPVITCEKCGSTETHRVIQSTPFLLQSCGWFKKGGY